MLAASASAPKPSSASPRRAPRPENWQGVEEGLTACARLLAAGEPEAAERTARQVLEFAPREGRAWHLLGRILQQMSRHGEALDCFARARACYEGSRAEAPPASLRLARMLWEQGERAEARAMLAVLMLRRPDDPELARLRESWEEDAAQAATPGEHS